MNLNKIYINPIHLVIAIAFVTSLLLTSSIELSFAKMDNENKHDEKDLKDNSVSSQDKNKKPLNDELKDKKIQNDILNTRYPNQFFVCGYPQQLITDYNSFEKLNCN
ncbi:MAG TPA: hypothetical protein VFP49_13275 [Nitrososphaeraceae archaeon]|nr:hypothetical protein [Nitrososphaeraceae archaeon]